MKRYFEIGEEKQNEQAQMISLLPPVVLHVVLLSCASPSRREREQLGLSTECYLGIEGME